MAMEDIIKAAIREDWRHVDEGIPKICNNEEIQDRAIGLLESENPNLRDLGAGIIEQAKINPNKFFAMIMPKLGAQLNDEHAYARYRAAFALAKHMTGKYDSKVRRVLMEAKKDSDVGEIAQGYLNKLNHIK